MGYKRIRVWNGVAWEQVGSQVPGVVDASGRNEVTLVAGSGSKSIAYGAVSFAFIPLVFVQVTGNKSATITVEADTVGFTVNVKGTGTDTITFDWFAVQAEFSV